jgi:signal peptidase II
VTVLTRYLWGPYSAIGGALALVAFLADRLHKWVMLDVVEIGRRGLIEVTGYFDLVLIWNQGVSYGLFQQQTASGQYILAGINVIVAAALWAWMSRMDTRLAAISAGLIIGGAIGNGVDRVLYGAVADFFHFHAYGWSWYVFNVADIAIVAGVAGLLYDSFRDSHKSAPNGD